MAYKLPNGSIVRNDPEQIRENKQNILRHFQEAKVMGDFGIRVIDRLDEWQIPTGTFEYGDAIAVGPEGGPFVFYIYTRGNPDYWFDYGAISVVGPQGPQGPKGDTGATGKSTRWYQANIAPSGPDLVAGDQWLNPSTGMVYQYSGTQWQFTGSIMGPQGPQGNEGRQGPQGIPGPQGPQGKDGKPSPIIDIIAELPADTVISDIYNPATMPTNSGVLMPVNGINHLFIIIQGEWTDSGAWGGGSSIYAGGEYVQEFNADTKLDKITATNTYDRAYGVLKNGTQAMITLCEDGGSPVYRGIPRYTGNGCITVNDPTWATAAANKRYVDNSIAAAHAGSLNPTQTNCLFVPWTAINGSGLTPKTWKINLGINAQAFAGTTAGVNRRAMGQCYYTISGGYSDMTYPYTMFEFVKNQGTYNTMKINVFDANTNFFSISGTFTVEGDNILFTGGIDGDNIVSAHLTIYAPPSSTLIPWTE